MRTKNLLLAIAIPLTFTSAFAAKQWIDPGELILKSARSNKSNFVLRDVKGNFIDHLELAAAPINWFNLSPADGSEGVRSEETYVTYGLPQSADVIVAVIDSGVDVNHEDLQGKIWINAGEVADNGIDDDKNGYVDDVFGWNFIGGANGMAKIVKDETLGNGLRLIKGDNAAQIDADTLEVTRELVRMKKLKARLEELGEELTPAQVAYLEKLQTEVNANFDEAKEVVADYTKKQALYKASEAVLRAAGVANISLEVVRGLESSDPAVLQAQKDMIELLANGLTEARITRVLGRYESTVKYHYNEQFNPRPVVGDNYLDQKESNYGNNDVIGPDSSHGTHVSGIIAAVRDNNLGIKGVATNVKIMAVRVVPNGDERDKDVANGIRYAVDNGAKIINMSFGKAYSPFKSVVDEAVRYAESKGVILVHAAGNDNKDNDILPSYPMRADKKGKDFSNWLEIGASAYEKGLSLPAVFTNFGKKSVDFFGPGVDILSTTPDNKYDTFSGTSMACPAVAGSLALVLSYDESLGMEGLRSLVIDTTRRHPKLKVKIPRTETQTLFSNLSIYGSIVDTFEAVKALK